MTVNDRSLRVLLTAIVVLLGANLLVNMNNSSGPRSAYAAGIPDSGAQLQAVVDSISDLNKKVDKLDSFLESGSLVVTVKKSADSK
jgi:hypothetical protein